MDDAGESGASEQTPPKIKAEDNPWYLLATLYGVPKSEDDELCAEDDELRARNRVAWNRYFAANLDEEARSKLIIEKRHPAEELTPFLPDELREVETAFAKRCKASAKKPCCRPATTTSIFQMSILNTMRFLLVVCSPAKPSSMVRPGDASFWRATFSSRAQFGGATFSCRAYFGHAAFSDLAAFLGTAFSKMASFSDADFSGGAYFDDANFSDETYFHRANFSVMTWFRDASLSGNVIFDDASFSGEANFRTANFGGTTSFVNAEMKDETSFEGAIFETTPPNFFGAKLHQGTVWGGIKLPPLAESKSEAGAFIDAYACLKLEMDRLKKHEDELDFFALEMQSRCVLLGPWRGLPIALYGALSDYGRSYLRPLVALLVVAAIGAGAFLYFDARAYGEALGLSAANTLNVFGFRRDFDLVVDTPFAWLKGFAAFQTIVGTILLFLFGLGIRNKFRMK